MQSKSRLSSKTSEPGCKFSTERTQAQAIAIRDEYVAACKRFVYQDSDVYSMIPYTFNTCTNTHTYKTFKFHFNPIHITYRIPRMV